MTTCEARRMYACVAVSCFVALSAISPSARAQAEDQAAARSLFDEGRGLMKMGHYADACPKLEAARKLYTSAGILLNLADCHEKMGRTASAWTEFGEAQTVAKRTARDADADEARRRQELLEPSLSRLVVRVSRAVPGLSVARDGTVLAPAAWGAALPVDPGEHAVLAEATGFEAWKSAVSVSNPGQVVTVSVPELRVLAAAAEPVTPARSSAEESGLSPDSSSFERKLGWTLVGGGAAIALGGGVLMLIESSRASTARDHGDPAAYDATKTPWTIGLVGVIVGATSAAVGGTLLALHRGDATVPAVSVWLDQSRGGLLLAGSW
jgi:hypothetical protein